MCLQPDKVVTISDQQKKGRTGGRSTRGTLPALFAAQAARQPAAHAIRYEGRAWTYSEVADRVNRLTRYLQARGVARGSRVPLFMRPTPEALPAMLAIMRAGAAYVPLDPDYAGYRLTQVLDEVQSPILLTVRGSVRAGQSIAYGGEMIRLDEIEGELDAMTADPVPDTATANDLAYVIYTSGTTGTPNGVEVPHAALANYLNWCVAHYPVGAGGGSIVQTSLGFDLTVTSLYVPLLTGEPVRFIASSTNDLAALARTLRESSDRYSLIKLTPSHLRSLRSLLAPADLARATGCLILGGEQLYGEDLAGFEPHLGTLRVFNEYGPTEATVGATCYEVTTAPAAGPIPIGTPIANVTATIVDEQLQAVPDGDTGELCLGGAGLARGYFQRDELTARRFVTLPDASGQRVYRTGDRVRRRADGQLELLGRLDAQVKLRGHRIELDEIETALRTHPAVAEAFVLLDGERDAARLVAFVLPNVSRRETETSAGRLIRDAVAPSELHAHLAGRLPDYLLPSLFVLLETVPTTVHGKVDREALRRRVAEGTQARAEYVRPRTELEESLSAVLSSVLKIEAIGIDDNYFALGGDSIRSIQLAGEARRRGITLSVGDIHRQPTIRTLAAHVATRRGVGAEMPQTKPFDLISAEDRARMPEDVEDAYPLNLLQEGMIYHRAFAAKSAVYHAMLSLKLQAPFDLDALRLVLQGLVNRHPLLRTSFDLRTFATPLQLVHRTFKDPLQFADLSGLSEAEQHAQIDAWCAAEKTRGFDVDEYPLIRFMIHRLGTDTFQLTFSYHHEIIDGWSESTMVSEVLTHYLSIVNGQPIEMQAPAASFRDAVLLEQMALKSDEFRRFWEQSLDGATFMRLPRLLSRPKADKGERAIVKLHFPFETVQSDGLKRLALALGVSLKAVLLGGHMKVMGLFGGSRDVLTHTVSTGRPESPDGIGLIGLFVNSFTFRQTFGQGSWRDVILQTMALEQASIPYRRYPMAELKRHQGRDPLSETLFFLIDYHVYHRLQRWTNAKLLHYDVYGESTFPFCATFRVNHFTSALDMQIEYDSLQFPRALIDAMAETYFAVFEAMLTNAAAPHQLFSPPRSAQPAILAAAPVATPAAATGGVHQWIEAQAARTPDALAVICGDETISYGVLNARANRIARWLQQQGVRPEDRIALRLDRSPAFVAAMLAVLKAGGCYIPLDPEHPRARVETMLAEANPTLTLTTDVLRDAEAASRSLSSDNLGLTIAPEQLAYMIFTSGSTGTPKGVMVSHGSLVRSTAARLSTYAGEPERFLLLSSHAFDSSIAGLYWTLCTGSTLILPAAGGPLDLNQVLTLTRREQVTHTLCIPSFYASMLESARPADLSTLHTVIVAGEECRRELWEQHKQQAPSVAFFNEYGPSEATVWSTVWKGDPTVPLASLPIGTPIANVTSFVLDRDLQHAPMGVAGELYVGGSNLARGYAGKAAATAERFVPDPFADTPGARLYRTGDLARVMLDGTLEYLGRLDHQIKVRGFRIEPAEIEAVLETQPDVKRAVVVPREDATHERVLVAYVVPSAPGAVSASTLLTFAKDKLPKYLIPSSFVVVEALPLTATGKVDRAALPAAPIATDAQRLVAPRTPTELAIAGIWSRVLGIEQVGVFDDFFALGGESLRAMRILSQIRRAFDVNLPIASLINLQATVAALAEEVDAELWLRAGAAVGVASDGAADLTV